jgi:hypothetical protein
VPGRHERKSIARDRLRRKPRMTFADEGARSASAAF